MIFDVLPTVREEQSRPSVRCAVAGRRRTVARCHRSRLRRHRCTARPEQRASSGRSCSGRLGIDSECTLLWGVINFKAPDWIVRWPAHHGTVERRAAAIRALFPLIPYGPCGDLRLRAKAGLLCIKRAMNLKLLHKKKSPSTMAAAAGTGPAPDAAAARSNCSEVDQAPGRCSRRRAGHRALARRALRC
jgi:hypothetical protein